MAPDALKMNSPSLSVSRFFVKHFVDYLSLHYETLFFLDDFKKNSYIHMVIQIKNLYGYKLVKTAKR